MCVCVGGAVVSPGVLVSFSNSMRQTLSSSLSQLWLWKQATVHRLMGRRDDGCEGRGTSCHPGGQGSQLSALATPSPLEVFPSAVAFSLFFSQSFSPSG